MKKGRRFRFFNFMILPYLLEKEIKQMMRNIILPIVFVLLPLAMVNMVPRVATQEVKNLTLSVVDNDHSTLSQRLIQKVNASTYFAIADVSPTYGKALESVEHGDADIIMEIPADFERDLVRDGKADVAISANAVNGVKAGLGSSYLSFIVNDFASEVSAQDHSVLSASPTTLPRYLFNTALDYKIYMVPAIFAMLLILIVGFLPALNIVGEKEKGTIEQMNVTPVGRFEFILSKLIPYWLVGLAILGYAMTLAWLIYGFVPAGRIADVFVFATLFILVVSSFGLIVSNYSDTTQQAAFVMFFFLVIFILMSGLITPITSMPEWTKAITTINPLRYFIEAMRTLYLKGSSLAQLRPQLLALSIYAVVTWTWAIVSYRKTN